MLEQLAARRAFALHEQIHFSAGEKILHLQRQLLHRAITGEEHKRAPIGVLDEARHPFRERRAVAVVARVGHLADDEQLHLLLEIKRAAELERLGLVRADPSPKISQIGPAHRERRARHHARAIFPEKHPAQDRRDIDRRGVKRDILRCFSRALDPVNVVLLALLQENRDACARVADAPPEFLQLGFEKFILGLSHHLDDARLERGEAPGDLVIDKIRFPHAAFAAFFEVGALVDRREKPVGLVHERRGQGHAGGIARDGEEPFLERAL